MTKIFAPIGVLFAVLTTIFVAAQYIDNDFDVYSRGDFATALRAVRPLAEQGDADAQYYLGAMYEAGRGVRQNHAEAAKWYRKAAEQSHAEAEMRLNNLHAQ
jgi:TPR repeat protein